MCSVLPSLFTFHSLLFTLTLDTGFFIWQSNLYSGICTLYFILNRTRTFPKKTNIFSCFRAYTIGIFFCMLLPSTRIQTSPAIKTPAQLQKIRQLEIAPYDSWLFNNDSPKTDISKQLQGPGVYPGFIKELPGHGNSHSIAKMQSPLAHIRI